MHRKPLLPLLLLALASRASAARVLTHDDLDSLIYKSTLIVRAQITAVEPFTSPDGDGRVHTLQILDTLKGNAPKTIRVTGLDAYRRAPGIEGLDDSWNLLQVNDTVYLFLVPNGTTGYSKYKLAKADFTVLESGARLLAANHVYSFGQLLGDDRELLRNFPGSPGPSGFVAMTTLSFSGAPVPTQKSFDNDLHHALENAPALAKLLTSDATPEALPARLQFLRTRPAVLRAQMATDDFISSQLLQKMGKLAPPETLDVLRRELPANSSTKSAYEFAFATPAGRNYLLGQIAEAPAPDERRKDWANVLARATHGSQRDPAFDARLATLAVDLLNLPLAETVLTSLAHEQGAPDKATVKILLDAFAEAPPRGKYFIADVLMQADRDAFRTLLPHANNLLTFLEIDPLPGAAPAGLRLRVRYRNNSIAPRNISLIFHPADAAAADIQIPVTPQIHATNFGYETINVAIPPDAPAGAYTLLLRAGNHEGLATPIRLPLAP